MKSPINQLFLALTEDASAELEAMLAEQFCAQHTGTSLERGACAMCDLDEMADRLHRRWQKQPEWVRRAEASLLPTKVIQ